MDLDHTYYWKVMAYDGSLYGNWSETWNFTLVSYVSVQVLNNVTFSQMAAGISNDTTDDSPPPFVVKSYSNTYIDLSSLNVSNSLWTSQPLNTSYWQMKVRSKSDGSFNESGSMTSFFNVTNTTYVLRKLNYSSIRNNASIDVNITVPVYEDTGDKSSTVTFLFEVAN